MKRVRELKPILLFLLIISPIVISGCNIEETKEILDVIEEELDIEEETGSSNITSGKINEDIQIGNFSLKVNSIKESGKVMRNCMESFGEYWCMVYKPKSDYKLIILTSTLTNNGIRKDNLEYDKVELKVDKGYIYEEGISWGGESEYRFITSEEKSKYVGDYVYLGTSILPREHITNQMIFEILKDTNPIELTLIRCYPFSYPERLQYKVVISLV